MRKVSIAKKKKMPNKALTKISYSWDCCKLKQDFFRSRPPAAGRAETRSVTTFADSGQSGARMFLGGRRGKEHLQLSESTPSIFSL